MATLDHVETARLVGRRPVPEDVEALLTIYADEAVAAWLWPGRLGGVRTRKQVTEIVEVFVPTGEPTASDRGCSRTVIRVRP